MYLDEVCKAEVCIPRLPGGLLKLAGDVRRDRLDQRL